MSEAFQNLGSELEAKEAELKTVVEQINKENEERLKPYQEAIKNIQVQIIDAAKALNKQ